MSQRTPCTSERRRRRRRSFGSHANFCNDQATLREAGTGREALALAKTRPDLILLDVNLPDLSGFEVCERLKEDAATSSIPVLFLSGAYMDPKDRVRGMEEGGDGYLTKPVDPAELVAYIKALLRLRHAETTAGTSRIAWPICSTTSTSLFCSWARKWRWTTSASKVRSS